MEDIVIRFRVEKTILKTWSNCAKWFIYLLLVLLSSMKSVDGSPQDIKTKLTHVKKVCQGPPPFWQYRRGHCWSACQCFTWCTWYTQNASHGGPKGQCHTWWIPNVNVSWHLKARDSNNFLCGPICNVDLFWATDSGSFSRSDINSEVGRGVSLEGTERDTQEEFVLSLIYAWGTLIAAKSWIHFTSVVGVSPQESVDLHVE